MADKDDPEIDVKANEETKFGALSPPIGFIDGKLNIVNKNSPIHAPEIEAEEEDDDSLSDRYEITPEQDEDELEKALAERFGKKDE